MAEAAASAPAPAQGAAPTGQNKTVLLVALTLGGAVLGGLAGSLVVAPRIIARQQPATHADSATAEQGGSGAGSGQGEDGLGEGERRLVELANIIVNPAGSQGGRFLMTSVAIAVTSAGAQKRLNDRQVELRDRITTILETQTMAELTAPGARDTLKLRIAATVSTMVGPAVRFQVYLPQFVIQ